MGENKFLFNGGGILGVFYHQVYPLQLNCNIFKFIVSSITLALKSITPIKTFTEIKEISNILILLYFFLN
jgi:hypothetical protein